MNRVHISIAVQQASSECHTMSVCTCLDRAALSHWIELFDNIQCMKHCIYYYSNKLLLNSRIYCEVDRKSYRRRRKRNGKEAKKNVCQLRMICNCDDFEKSKENKRERNALSKQTIPSTTNHNRHKQTILFDCTARKMNARLYY